MQMQMQQQMHAGSALILNREARGAPLGSPSVACIYIWTCGAGILQRQLSGMIILLPPPLSIAQH
jgi:hypothetical protein